MKQNTKSVGYILQFPPLCEGHLAFVDIIFCLPLYCNSRPSARSIVQYLEISTRALDNYNSCPSASGIAIRLVWLLCRFVIATHVPPRGASPIFISIVKFYSITTHAHLRGASRFRVRYRYRHYNSRPSTRGIQLH